MTLNEELDMGHLKESIRNFVEKHIIADDPSPERSWLDNLSGELEPPVEELPETA
ncbi:hypothetical protein [uncultured Arthrobacter sp.]|uniref:hypothetical protein n=1 Tax=uncultured Arthrobacter sp. TaxID=114050 RepID=UPI00261AE1A9|nr:hypothetical protein [uncultured Arthrobacter sp.]